MVDGKVAGDSLRLSKKPFAPVVPLIPFPFWQLFVSKDAIARTLKSELEHEMNQFGYTIVQTLITGVHP